MENMYAVLVITCLIGSMLLIAFAFVVSSVRIVPADKRLSVHRLGQYIGDKGPGIVILMPFIDRGVMKDVGVSENSPFQE